MSYVPNPDAKVVEEVASPNKVTRIYGDCESENCGQLGACIMSRPDGGEKFVCNDCRDELYTVYGWKIKRLLP